MKKMTFDEVWQMFTSFNEARTTEQARNGECLKAVVVFKQGDWFKEEYTEEQRSYLFSSENKYFKSYMGGNSLYADCLDGVDRGVRLDWYLGEWVVDYCYLKEE